MNKLVVGLINQKVTFRVHEQEPFIIIRKRSIDGQQNRLIATMNLLFDDAIKLGEAAKREKERRETLGLR